MSTISPGTTNGESLNEIEKIIIQEAVLNISIDKLILKMTALLRFCDILSSMTDFMREIAQRLKEQYSAKEIILFGSFARGEQNIDSDIDLLIISDTKERFFERQASVRRLLRDLKKGVPISPIVLTPDELEDRKKIGDHFVMEILKTGIRA